MLTKSLRQLGKSVGRCSQKSIAIQAVKDHHILKWLLIKIGKKLKSEPILTASRSELQVGEIVVVVILFEYWLVPGYIPAL